MQPNNTAPYRRSEETPEKKPTAWRIVYIMLGVLQLVGVSIALIALLWASHLSNNGVSGLEYIIMFLGVTLIPAVAILAYINLAGLPIYMLRHKPKGKGLVFGVLSVFLSLVVVLYGLLVALRQ